MVCAKSPTIQVDALFNFSQIEKHFFQLIYKFLKYEEMEHHVTFETRPTLLKFSILFSTVKLKLGYKFSKFIFRSKIGTFESWS